MRKLFLFKHRKTLNSRKGFCLPIALFFTSKDTKNTKILAWVPVCCWGENYEN